MKSSSTSFTGSGQSSHFWPLSSTWSTVLHQFIAYQASVYRISHSCKEGNFSFKTDAFNRKNYYPITFEWCTQNNFNTFGLNCLELKAYFKTTHFKAPAKKFYLIPNKFSTWMDGKRLTKWMNAHQASKDPVRLQLNPWSW